VVCSVQIGVDRTYNNNYLAASFYDKIAIRDIAYIG
jgi:hypothetical protein